MTVENHLYKIKNKVNTSAQKILDLAIVGQEKFSMGNKFLEWFYQYIFLNIILARPSFSVICTRERNAQLTQLGISESGKISLIATQFMLDHSLPNAFIAGAFTLINQVPELPLTIVGPASWAAGRIGWGVTSGLIHAGAYAITKPLPDLEEFWQETNVPNFTDVSPYLPWPLNKLDNQLYL